MLHGADSRPEVHRQFVKSRDGVDVASVVLIARYEGVAGLCLYYPQELNIRSLLRVAKVRPRFSPILRLSLRSRIRGVTVPLLFVAALCELLGVKGGLILAWDELEFGNVSSRESSRKLLHRLHPKTPALPEDAPCRGF